MIKAVPKTGNNVEKETCKYLSGIKKIEINIKKKPPILYISVNLFGILFLWGKRAMIAPTRISQALEISK